MTNTKVVQASMRNLLCHRFGKLMFILFPWLSVSVRINNARLIFVMEMILAHPFTITRSTGPNCIEGVELSHQQAR